MTTPFSGSGFFMKHTFLLLGASSGIGLALARVLLQQGYQVILLARREEPMQQLQAEFPERAHYYVRDLLQPALEQALDEIVAGHPQINRIVYLAGWGDLNPDLQKDIELRTQALNTETFTRVAVWATHFLSQQSQAVFTNISSIGGLRGSGLAPAYNASKAYQINYLEGLRQRANKQKLQLRYLDIRPGFVQTDMAKGEGQFWVASPAKAAQQIAKQLTKNRLRDLPEVLYITKRWKIVALILKFLPTWLYKKM